MVLPAKVLGVGTAMSRLGGRLSVGTFFRGKVLLQTVAVRAS
jgi:hypothetical protein